MNFSCLFIFYNVLQIILQNMFKSQYLNDKHPVIVIKDMEFDNLKSLVEYMYKGETNVAQPMLPAFIKDAESLQIRGLADFSNKHLEAENAGHLGSIGSSPSRLPQHSAPPVLPQGPLNSTPISSKKSKNSNSLAGGILAARLAKMSDQVPPPMSMFDFAPENFPSMLRNPAFMAAAASAASGATPSFPPPMKKSRKSAEPRPRGGSPTKEANKKSKLKNSSSSLVSSNPLQTNNNFEDMEEGGLKIDEDADPGKENLEAANKMETVDDIAEIDNSNGVSEEEEEPSMPGPGGELAEAASKFNKFSWLAFPLPCQVNLVAAATLAKMDAILSRVRARGPSVCMV